MRKNSSSIALLPFIFWRALYPRVCSTLHTLINSLFKYADLVIISIPVDATVKLLPTVLDLIPDTGLVVDAGSTKANICKVVENHPKRRNFLAMHPIAGTEHSGPEAAISGLFKGKTNIICEVEKTTFKLQEKALDLFRTIGMQF